MNALPFAKPRAWLLLCAVFCALTASACDDAKKVAAAPTPTLAELLAGGKTALSENRYFQAEAAFMQVTARESGNTEALYGLCLVNLEQTLAQVDLISALVAPPAAADGDAEATEAEKSAAVALLATSADGDAEAAAITGIDSLLDTLVAQQDAQLARLETLLAANEPSITLDKLPIVLKGSELFSLRGRFAKADLHLLAALSHTLRGVFGLLASQRLGDLNDHIGDLSTLLGGKVNLARALPALLAAHPALLTLRSDGAARFGQAREDLKAAAAAMLQAAQALATEKGDTTDRVTAAVMVDEIANLALRGNYPTGKSQILLLWQGKNYSLQETFTRLLAHLSGDGSLRLRGDYDVTVLLAVLLDAVRQSITLEKGAALLGLTLPASLTKPLAIVKDDQGERLPNALFLVLAAQFKFKTAAIELDLLNFFSRPLNLRELLPASVVQDPIAKLPMWLKSSECALAGFEKKQLTPGESLTLYVFDESLIGQAAPAITLTSYSSDPATPLDKVPSLPLTAHPTLTGLYTAALQTTNSQPTSGLEDTVLSLTATSRIRISKVGGDAPSIIADLAPGALPLFDLAGSCDPLATLSDHAHFASTLFAQVSQLPDPPAAATPSAAPYPVYPADKQTNAWPLLAWPSPAMNGLLWLDVD